MPAMMPTIPLPVIVAVVAVPIGSVIVAMVVVPVVCLLDVVGVGGHGLSTFDIHRWGSERYR